MNRLPGQLYTHTYTHILIILSMHNTRLSTVISYYNYGQQETIKTGNKSRSQGQPYSHILIMLIRHEYVNDNK